MMNCRRLVELLIDYVADELPPDVRQHIDQHICFCAPCQVYLETYQVTIRLTRKLPATPPPPELLTRLRAALEEQGTC
jgi:anti-sigma factor RsiW